MQHLLIVILNALCRHKTLIKTHFFVKHIVLKAFAQQQNLLIRWAFAVMFTKTLPALTRKACHVYKTPSPPQSS